jgi:HCOMODA/2-hydroxy-3-carboxy-muconic semialdehyde decarboxylase
MSAMAEARKFVAQASRILAGQQVLDAFGHVSCRSPRNPERFLIPRSLAPALITPDDVVELDLNSDPVGPHQAALFLERFIHGEIYRLRADVQAVVHSHALPVLPFAIVPGAQIKPICHMSGFLAGTPEAFSVADHAGSSSNLLIASRELGRHLAEHLGDATVVPMRSHGFTCVGTSVPQAVYRAYYTMRNCEIDIAARAIGTPTYLNIGESDACDKTINGALSRAWELWVDQFAIAEGV